MTPVVNDVAGLRPVREALRAAIAAGTPIGFDVETHGPYIQHPADKKKRKPDALRHRIVGYGVTIGRDGWYVNVRGPGVHTAENAEYILNALRLLRFTSRPDARVVAHNWAFEYQVLANEGVPVRCHKLDSMLAAWHRGMRLPNPRGLKLKPLMEHYFNRTRPDFDAVMRGRAVCDVPAEEVAPYCVADCRDAVDLWTRCWDEMSAEERDDYTRVEAPTIDVVAHMMHTGVLLDEGLLTRTSAQAKARMAELAAAFERMTTTEVLWPTKTKVQKTCVLCAGSGVIPDGRGGAMGCDATGCVDGVLHFKNGKVRTVTELRPAPTRRGAAIGSDRQVGRWMYDELKWWPTRGATRTKDGHWSVKSDFIKPYVALDGDAGEAARMRLEYQALSKYADLYTSGLLAIARQYGDGRLHTSYLQTGTQTGRFSSSFPNISNIPNHFRVAAYGVPAIRAAFVAPPGWRVVNRDISQAELRILAYLSRDPVLLRVYLEGGDVHAEVMEELGIPDRVPAKTTTFSCLYRIGARTLATKLTVATGKRYTPRDAASFIDGFHSRFKRVAWYHQRAIEVARERGYARSLGGFRMPLPASEWAARKHYTENRAINYPIQGTVGTVLKRAMVALYELWRSQGVLAGLGGSPDGRVVLQQQTYDEIGVLAREDFAEQANEDMRRVMESEAVRAPMTVPLVSSGGIGATWESAKG